MSEAELILVTDTKNCTMYTIQFLSDDDSEFEKFYAKFRNDLEYNEDFEGIVFIVCSGFLDSSIAKDEYFVRQP